MVATIALFLLPFVWIGTALMREAAGGEHLTRGQIRYRRRRDNRLAETALEAENAALLRQIKDDQDALNRMIERWKSKEH